MIGEEDMVESEASNGGRVGVPRALHETEATDEKPVGVPKALVEEETTDGG
jgi:hypothetical protein